MDYKQLYDKSQKELLRFKQKSRKAVDEYEELHKKFVANEKQYGELQTRLRRTEDDYRKLAELLEPAIGEFTVLKTKFDIEKVCREQAEIYASQINSKNVKLKRQSAMLLDLVQSTDLSIAELGDLTGDMEDDGTIPDHVEHLNNKISELESQVATLEVQLSQSQQQRADAIEKQQRLEKKLADDHEMLEQYKASVEQHQKSLEQFNRVSVVAYQEFDQLKEKYEQERLLKDKAIEQAQKAVAENRSAQRQSSLVLQSAMEDERMMKALHRIEELEKELVEMQLSKQRNSQEVESLLEEAADLETLTRLEQQLEESGEQINALKQQLKDVQNWRDKVEKENSELREKLNEAEDKLRAPPPPPPPPLPPIGFIQTVKKFTKKKAEPVINKPKDENAAIFDNALKEMMDRINRGTIKPSAISGPRRANSVEDEQKGSLDSGRRPSDTSAKQSDVSTQNIEELHKLVRKNLNRSYSSGEVLSNVRQNDLQKIINKQPVPANTNGTHSAKDSEVSELQRTFNKVRGEKAQKELSLIPEEKSHR